MHSISRSCQIKVDGRLHPSLYTSPARPDQEQACVAIDHSPWINKQLWLRGKRHRQHHIYRDAGWWFETLWNILVNWDDDIPNRWKNKSHVPNHQPDIVYVFEGTLGWLFGTSSWLSMIYVDVFFKRLETSKMEIVHGWWLVDASFVCWIMNVCDYIICVYAYYLVGDFNPSENIKVSWENHPQYMDTKSFSRHHQPFNTIPILGIVVIKRKLFLQRPGFWGIWPSLDSTLW